LQSRDPFSGDCDTSGSRGPAVAGFPDTLQSRDPFSGDCDRLSPGSPGCFSSYFSYLQSRDPFSGDCDEDLVNETCLLREGNLQSRDPFSGDCDLWRSGPGRGNRTSPLAEPRPVLRGLRRGWKPIYGSPPGILPLAEPRPVLRGLRHARRAQQGRHGLGHLQSRDPFSGDCDACVAARVAKWANAHLQSRDPFSGDCDGSFPPAGRLPGPRSACRAETRSQGIATSSTAPGGRQRPHGLQSRDPFSGDCDLGDGLPQAAHGARLQSRDPFSGDCDTRRRPGWPNGRMPRPCRAETRSQGIATPGPRKMCPSSRIAALQSRDPFSGDCDPRRWSSSGAMTPEDNLQSRDPFSGDCDAHSGARIHSAG